MVGLLLACLSMAAQDGLGVFLVVAETRGRAVLAGGLDAAGDLARQLVTVYAAGTVIKDGWTPHSMIIMAAVMVTSFVGTTIDTRLARRVKADGRDLAAELDALSVEVQALRTARTFQGKANL